MARGTRDLMTRLTTGPARRSWARIALALAVVAMMSLATVEEVAAQKPLRGNWIFTIQTPQGALPVSMTFLGKAKGTGTITTFDQYPLVYRMNGATVSIATELPGHALDGSDMTMILRGTMQGDNQISGKAIFMMQTADSSATGFVTTTYSFSVTRQ